MVDKDGNEYESVFSVLGMDAKTISDVDQAIPKYIDAWDSVLQVGDDVWHHTHSDSEVFAATAAGLIGFLKSAGVTQEQFETIEHFGHLVYLLSAAAVRTMHFAHNEEDDPELLKLIQDINDIGKE
jgi:hypothetical protein